MYVYSNGLHSPPVEASETSVAVDARSSSLRAEDPRGGTGLNALLRLRGYVGRRGITFPSLFSSIGGCVGGGRVCEIREGVEVSVSVLAVSPAAR